MIERLKCAIAEADAIVIGAGAGLSTSGDSPTPVGVLKSTFPISGKSMA